MLYSMNMVDSNDNKDVPFEPIVTKPNYRMVNLSLRRTTKRNKKHNIMTTVTFNSKIVSSSSSSPLSMILQGDQLATDWKLH